MVEKKKRGKCKCGNISPKCAFSRFALLLLQLLFSGFDSHAQVTLEPRFASAHHCHPLLQQLPYLSSLSFLLRYLICYQSPVTTKEIRLDEDVAVTLK